MPIAVRIGAMVIPCSRNRVRMRSASVVSSWRIRLNVSRIRETLDRRAALLIERASSLDCLSSSMLESHFRASWFCLEPPVGVRRRPFPSVSDAPGLCAFQLRIFYHRGRELCQVVGQHLSLVIASWSPASSCLAHAALSYGSFAKAVSTWSALWPALMATHGSSSFDVFSIAREIFIRLPDCFLSGSG